MDLGDLGYEGRVNSTCKTIAKKRTDLRRQSEYTNRRMRVFAGICITNACILAISSANCPDRMGSYFVGLVLSLSGAW